MRARDLMQRQPITLEPSTPFLEIQHLFVVTQISGAPIVDERGDVLGVVSSSDLLRVLDEVCDDDIDPADPAEDLAERLRTITALEIGGTDAVWVSPLTPLARVAQIMRTEGIHRVLVGEPGHLAGLLSAFDLLHVVGA